VSCRHPNTKPRRVALPLLGRSTTKRGRREAHHYPCSCLTTTTRVVAVPRLLLLLLLLLTLLHQVATSKPTPPHRGLLRPPRHGHRQAALQPLKTRTQALKTTSFPQGDIVGGGPPSVQPARICPSASSHSLPTATTAAAARRRQGSRRGREPSPIWAGPPSHFTEKRNLIPRLGRPLPRLVRRHPLPLCPLRCRTNRPCQSPPL